MERFWDRNRVYILGGAQSDFERNWTKEGKNAAALLKEAVTDAFKAASVDREELERLKLRSRAACYIGNFISEQYIKQGHTGALVTEADPVFWGIPSAGYEAACASGSAAIDAAISHIRAGDCDLAVVAGWELMKTVDAKTGGDYLGMAAYYEEEGKGVSFPFPRLFGRLADETIEKYKVEEKRYMDALSRIAELNYRNAKKNPLAQTRNWYMSYEHARNRGEKGNPLIGGRLAVSDCSQVTDGAAVVLLASEGYVSDRFPGREYPVVKGYGHRTAPMQFEKKLKESRGCDYILPWTRQAVLDAYGRAGLTVEDMDCFETHDCFTSSEYMAISAFGISSPGKEYEAIENGSIEMGGANPINPSGGLIGCGHPVGASGVRMLLDLYKQVTGTAGGYQVLNARNGMMLNFGGTATTNYVFIVGR